MLGDAGFTDVHTDEVPMRFAFRDVDEYERWVTDLSGSFATVLLGLSEGELEAVRVELNRPSSPMPPTQGYELGGVALTAVASRGPTCRRSAKKGPRPARGGEREPGESGGVVTGVWVDDSSTLTRSSDRGGR